MKKAAFALSIVLTLAAGSPDANAFGKPKPKPTPTPTPTQTSAPVFSDDEQAREAVRRAYLAILQRNADEGGAGDFFNQIKSDGMNGWRTGLANLSNSGEFNNDVRPNKSDEQILETIYRYFLLRSVDPSGAEAYLPLIAAGRTAEVAQSVGTSSEFFDAIKQPLPQPKPTPTPTPTFTPAPARKGLVRKCDKATCDDDGAFNALGATIMWAVWGYKHDRAKLERNLAFLQENGFHYIRALGTVGRLPWWEGRVIDWKDADHADVIAGLTDLAYDKYGLRIEWTLIGDGDQMIPHESDRYRLVDRFLAMSRGREHKIMHFEIGNEAWQNGFSVGAGYEQLRRLTRYMNDRTDIMVASSAPSGGEYNGDYCRENEDISRDASDMATFHYDRDTRMVDGFWRHVRQPWENCSLFSSNNEPMGPGSSVAMTNNPYYLVSAAILTYVSKGAMYVWHTEAGVWGGTIKENEGKSDLYENPSGTAFRAMNRLLPAGLAGWSRQNTYNNSSHPFLIYAGGHADKIWPEGYSDGVVRAYGSTRGNDFVVIPIGIKNFAKMEARRNMDVEIYDVVTGELLDVRSMNRGESITLQEAGKGTYLMRGRFR